MKAHPHPQAAIISHHHRDKNSWNEEDIHAGHNLGQEGPTCRGVDMAEVVQDVYEYHGASELSIFILYFIVGNLVKLWHYILMDAICACKLDYLNNLCRFSSCTMT
jgi:hypothetical protein